jgi:titin
VWRNNYPDPFITVTIERKSLSNPTYSVIAQNIATFNIVMGTFDDNSAYSPNTYTYRMRITDGTFYSEYSEEKSIAMPIPLSAPSNLTAQVFGNGKVILDWVDNSVNESYFSIERRVAAAVTFEKIGQVPANTTTYTDTALLSNTTFVYRIKAVTATDSALSNEAQVTTPLHIYPPPTDISLFNLGGGAVRISWKNNYPDVSVTVQIERKSTTSPNFLLVADNIGTFNQPYGNYTDNNAPGPNTYYYRLRITDGTFYSDYSVTATITIP